ncbi:hypothetical protein FIBSPDRAFT_371698 [Athelia psychrophila]|uniref:Uncharacterized protein n=1 Tax=Athelia psychrophila TaxID=1759441 RepID=A0A166VU00_9AGAM|nr:hypothetical protein FIBSPDRAFT_371698 [Fibularhizoctonia sp. CBS 109695]
MNSSVVSAEMPNPYTAMAFLAPSVAQVHEVSAYIYISTVGALTWDWLMSMPDEYKVLLAGGISLPNIVYICARVFTLAFCLSQAIFQVAPVGNCQTFALAIAGLIVLSLNANTLLFFFRVRAVYGNSLRITIFFGFWSLVVFSSSILALFAFEAQHIGPTKYCTEPHIKPWIAAIMISNVVNDTLVFLAISHRIASQSVGEAGWRSALGRFFRGDGAPRVVKDLLYNGQLCYFASIVMCITQIIMALTTRYTATLTIPVIALESAMTCRVHRGIILGLAGNRKRQTGPFVLTTVITSEDIALQERALDPKSELERWERQQDSVSDCV